MLGKILLVRLTKQGRAFDGGPGSKVKSRLIDFPLFRQPVWTLWGGREMLSWTRTLEWKVCMLFISI